MKKLLAIMAVLGMSIAPARAAGTCDIGWCDNINVSYFMINNSTGWISIKIDNTADPLECGPGVGQPKEYLILKPATGSDSIYSTLLSLYISGKPIKRLRLSNLPNTDCTISYIWG